MTLKIESKYDGNWVDIKPYGTNDISLRDFTTQQIAQLVHELSAMA